MKRILALILLLAVAVPAPAYWVHKTATLKGRRQIVVRDSVRYLYLRVSKKHPARWTLKRSKSVKFRLENLSKRGPARVRLLRNGKPLKTWQVKRRREVRIHLPKGRYRLTSDRPVRIRYYEWRKPELRRVVPLTGGLPATLAVKDKRTTYYWVRPDGPVEFQVKGPARVWFYFRALQNTPVAFRVLEGDSVIFRLKNRWKPSLRARVLEDTSLRVTRPRKRFLKVPPGEHRYRVEVTGGRGLVKLYREVPKTQKRRSRRTSPRERLLGAPRGSLYVPLFLVGLPRRARTTLSLQTQLAFLSNPFTFAPDDLDRIRVGDAGYRYPDVQNPTDLRLRLRATLTHRGRRGRLSGSLTAYGHLWNRVKNRIAVAIEGSRRLERRHTLGFRLALRPGVYVRPVYRRSLQRTDPLRYSALSAEVWGRRALRRGSWTVGLGWAGYRYDEPFAYVSGQRWHLRLEGRRRRYGLGLRLGVYRTRVQPWEPDASYAFVTGQLELRVAALRASASLTWKHYLTNRADDALHYGREDREAGFRIQAPVLRPVPGGPPVFGFVAYRGRRVHTTDSATSLVFKNYDAWTVGFSGSWRLLRR